MKVWPPVARPLPVTMVVPSRGRNSTAQRMGPSSDLSRTEGHVTRQMFTRQANGLLQRHCVEPEHMQLIRLCQHIELSCTRHLQVRPGAAERQVLKAWIRTPPSDIDMTAIVHTVTKPLTSQPTGGVAVGQQAFHHSATDEQHTSNS